MDKYSHEQNKGRLKMMLKWLYFILVIGAINSIYYLKLRQVDVDNRLGLNMSFIISAAVLGSIAYIMFTNNFKWVCVLSILGFIIGKYKSYSILTSQLLSGRLNMSATLSFLGYTFLGLMLGITIDVMLFPKQKENLNNIED